MSADGECRREFEKAYALEYPPAGCFDRDPNGDYRMHGTYIAWKWWQAAWGRAGAEGWQGWQSDEERAMWRETSERLSQQYHDAERFRVLCETSPNCLCFMGDDFRTADEFRTAIDKVRREELDQRNEALRAGGEAG